MDQESRVEKERKSEVVGSITDAGYIEEVEGRTGAEEERKRREAKTGRRTMVRCDDKANSAHTG